MQSCSKSCCIELICIRIQQKNYEKKLNLNKRKLFIYIYLNKHSFWHLEYVRVQVIAHCAFKVKKKKKQENVNRNYTYAKNFVWSMRNTNVSIFLVNLKWVVNQNVFRFRGKITWRKELSYCNCMSLEVSFWHVYTSIHIYEWVCVNQKKKERDIGEKNIKST